MTPHWQWSLKTRFLKFQKGLNLHFKLFSLVGRHIQLKLEKREDARNNSSKCGIWANTIIRLTATISLLSHGIIDRIVRIVGNVKGFQKEPAAALQWLLGVSAAGYLWEIIEDIKSCQPEVKASKSDKRLRSYGHLQIRIVSDPRWRGADAYSSPCRRLLGNSLTTLKCVWISKRAVYLSLMSGAGVDCNAKNQAHRSNG